MTYTKTFSIYHKLTKCMKFNHLLLLFCCIVSIGCHKEYTDYDIFNGTIVSVEDTITEIKSVEFNTMQLDGSNYGFISSYDSLILYMNPKLRTHFYQIFSHKTEKELGVFVKRGTAPNEYISTSPLFQFYQNNGDLKTIFFAPNEEKLVFWNISKTLAHDSLVIDKILPFQWRIPNNGACYNEIFLQSSSTIYAKVTSVPINDGDATLPYYKVWNFEKNITDTIHVFKRSIPNKKKKILPETFFYSHDAMKPDGSKIAQAMLNVPQINIIDLNTKEIIGYRLPIGESFSIFGNEKKMSSYFIRMHVDDNNIYATYWGKEKWNDHEIPYINTIYVFNWEGHLQRKIKINCDIKELFINQKDSRIYATSIQNDDIYYFDINDIMEGTKTN